MSKSRMSLSKWVEIGIWTAVVVIFFGASFVYNGGHNVFKYGTAAWPRALLILMALAIIGQLVEDLSSARHKAAESEEAKSSKGFKQWFKGLERIRVVRSLGAFLLPFGYVLLLPGMGFYALTPFFIVAYILNFGEKRVWTIALTTVIIYSILTVVFTRWLYVGLPLGNWPGFHRVGAVIVNAISPQ